MLTYLRQLGAVDEKTFSALVSISLDPCATDDACIHDMNKGEQ